MKRRLFRFISLILCLAFFAGCGSSASIISAPDRSSLKTNEPEAELPEATAVTATPTPTKTPTPEPTETPEPTPEPVVVLYRNPLSGLPVDSDISALRPFIVMCDNTYLAVPHAGVSKSDMIMEMMEEGGITRMMAFYMDTTGIPELGPVRSVRAYNVYTALGYDAIIVHAGGSTEADGLIAQYGLQDVNSLAGTGGSFYRAASRIPNGEVHALMITGSDARSTAVNAGYSLTHSSSYDTTYGLVFDENAADQCTGSAYTVVVTYNGGKTSTFYYNESSGTYAFYEFGSQYVDEDGSAVPMTNVIMIYANTYLQSDGKHLTIELTSGDGYYFTKGRAVHILWYKSSVYDVFHYTLDDGTPLRLTPGRTFVAVNQCGSYQGSVSFS